MLFNSPQHPPATAPYAPDAGRRGRRWLVCVIAAGALLLASAGNARVVAAGILHLRCSNPASGTNWPIVVDLDHGKVDSFPATISEKWISWHDPKEGFFDLERVTGELQFRNASSTGGYFLHYKCRPE
jgi:hypothetical protein